MAVELGVEAPQAQRRATVAFRLLLAIPHLLIGSLVLGTIALVVVVIAWFAALLTGRVPYGIADLLARILQYQARMYGYGQLLLTDRFPPFTIGPADFPVELGFDEVGRFNRAAVLFRAVLMLPALLVTQIVTTGVTAVMLVLWLITLIAGRMPDAAHMAMASTLRYQMRTYAYIGLVTTTYPWGLFGDDEVEATELGTTEGELPASPHVTRFVLSRASKNLLVLILVLGAALQTVNVATTAGSFSRGFTTARELDDDFGTFVDAAVTWSQRVGICSESGCVRVATATFAYALDTFHRELDDLDMPSSAEDEAAVVGTDLDHIDELLTSITTTDDDDIRRRNVFEVLDALYLLDDHYQDLYEAVLTG